MIQYILKAQQKTLLTLRYMFQDSTNTEVVLESTKNVQETLKSAMTTGTDASVHCTSQTTDNDLDAVQSTETRLLT